MELARNESSTDVHVVQTTYTVASVNTMYMLKRNGQV